MKTFVLPNSASMLRKARNCMETRLDCRVFWREPGHFGNKTWLQGLLTRTLAFWGQDLTAGSFDKNMGIWEKTWLQGLPLLSRTVWPWLCEEWRYNEDAWFSWYQRLRAWNDGRNCISYFRRNSFHTICGSKSRFLVTGPLEKKNIGKLFLKPIARKTGLRSFSPTHIWLAHLFWIS